MLDINIQKLSLSLDPKKYNIDRVSGVFLFFVFFRLQLHRHYILQITVAAMTKYNLTTA